MNTCETCKHWMLSGPTATGICERISGGDPYDGEERARSIAYTAAGDSPSVLVTEPTFGCTLHEAKQ